MWKTTGFYMKKNANLLGFSTSFRSLCFCNCPFIGRRWCMTCIWISCCREVDDLPAPTLQWSSLLSSPLFPPLVPWNSFYNSWYDCWFSSINPFAKFAKSINDFKHFFWGILAIHDSVYVRGALATGLLYCLNELIAWQVFVACLPSISLISRSK